MTRERIQTSLGTTVIFLTKFLMKHYSIGYEEAFKKLVDTDFYEKLADPETGLFLESTDYLIEACRLELEQGKDAMYDFIMDKYM